MARHASSLGLAELIDLELAVGRLDDWRASAAAAGEDLCQQQAISAADARRHAETDGNWRRKLASAFLQRIRGQGNPLAGQRLVRSLTSLTRVLCLIGVLLGGATLLASLARPSGAPTNLWGFLAVFVFLQVVLLLVLIGGMASRKRRSGQRNSWAERYVARLASSGHLRKLLATDQEDWHSTAKLWQRPASISARARGWALFSSTQAFGVAFHCAASALFFALVMFSDLAFSWSTTPAGFEPDFLASVVHFLAAPWHWAWPQSVPTAEAIQVTQWSRLEGTFVEADPQLAARASAAWWSFLWMAHLAWALLPRVVAWVWGGRQLRGALARQDFDQAEFHALFDAMLPAQVDSWDAPRSESVRGELLPPPQTASRSNAEQSSTAAVIAQAESRRTNEQRSALGLVWGDFTQELGALSQQLASARGWQVREWRAIGGADAVKSLAHIEQTLSHLRELRDPAIAIAAEAKSTPNKALLRLLRELRDALPQQAPILLALVDRPSAADADLWHAYLQRAVDPFLRVEVLA